MLKFKKKINYFFFQYQYLTILCLEVHVTTRKDFLPDPRHDQIEAIFYIIHNDVPLDSNVKRLEQGKKE